MNILVVFTGGTIGSMISDGFISPDGKTGRLLIDQYESLYGNKVNFITREPYSILSENLTYSDLNLLVECVVKEAGGDYDGIIVTHGTDTIQYSASALSYALGTKSIPVVLVSSNFPLDNPRSNGLVNFAAAVEFIKQKKGSGVFVAYQNENGCVHFHRGEKLLSHREGDDSLFSVDGKFYASLSDGEITVFDTLEEREGLGAFTLCEGPSILVVDACPGGKYDFNVGNCNAIIFRPYHSGTLNTSNQGFEKFCLSVSEKGVPVFVVNVKEGTTYLSSKEFDRLHIIPLYSSSFISTYVRLWIAISRGEDLKNIF